MDRTSRTLLITLIVLLVTALAFPMAVGGLMGMRAMRMGMMGPAGAQDASWSMALMMGLGILATLAFWGAIIVGVALLVRMLSGGPRNQTPQPDLPLDVLRRRFAAGEISEEQFHQMRRVLDTLPAPSVAVPDKPPEQGSTFGQ